MTEQVLPHMDFEALAADMPAIACECRIKGCSNVVHEADECKHQGAWMIRLYGHQRPNAAQYFTLVLCNDCLVMIRRLAAGIAEDIQEIIDMAVPL